MAKGRKPQPDEIRNLKGDPGKRANKTVPEDTLKVGKGEAPAHLRKKSKELWEKVAPGLRQARLLRESDEPMLEICVDMMADYWAWGERIRRDGYVQKVTTYGNTDRPTTVMRPHPLIRERKALAAVLKDYIDRLGLSPVSRSQLISAMAFRPSDAPAVQRDLEDDADPAPDDKPDPMNFPAVGNA